MNTNGVRKKLPWLKPIFLLLGATFYVYFSLHAVDKILHYFKINIFADWYAKDLSTLINGVAGLPEAITAILGIEITTLAIVVQLAANKYSSKIFDLFLKNRVNVIVMFIFILTAACTLLVTNTLRESEPLPGFTITVTLFLIVTSLIIIIPHFNYVFYFLKPENFLTFVREDITKKIKKVADGEKPFIKADIEEVKEGINFMGDVAINSVVFGDRAVSLLCVSNLQQFAVEYINYKKNLPEGWFKLTGTEGLDPDFSSFANFVMSRIAEQKILIETKVFKVYELLFDNSRRNLRDVASGVLFNSEMIATSAIKSGDSGSLKIILQYFNTYIRIGIRERDPRAVFTTLEHYRLVAEALLDYNPKRVEEVSFYFKYYGQEAEKNNVLFILETVSYDLCILNERAYEKNVPNIRELLDIFLTLDQPITDKKTPVAESKEVSLIGVRIAQARLAAFYLRNNENDLAKLIYEDMKVEPVSRIEKIKNVIFTTTNEEFWEITPRGINFYYMSDSRKEALKTFFSWFEE